MGKQRFSTTNQLNGTIVEVRNNLWQALKHIRLAGSVRTLWIDALCINQQDISERNHQVSQMGRIYESAVGVLAWLGLLDDWSVMATTYLSKFEIKLNERDLSTPKALWHQLPVFDDGEMLAICSFCTRDYWSRLWIIQELVVASRITLHCGKWSCPWILFTLFFQRVEIYDLLNKTRRRAYHSEPMPVLQSVPRMLMRERDYLQSNSLRPLLLLCIQYGTSKCEDRRDKVFGLQALTLTCCKEAVQVE